MRARPGQNPVTISPSADLPAMTVEMYTVARSLIRRGGTITTQKGRVKEPSPPRNNTQKGA